MLNRLIKYLVEHDYRLLICLISSVILAGIVYSIYLGDKLRYYDEREYYSLATHLVNEHNYSIDGQNPSVFRPPGYPIFLAVFIQLGAGIVMLRIVNFIALGACIYLMHRLLLKPFGNVAATIAIILTACYPVLFYTAGTLYPQCIASLLLLWIVYLLTNQKLSVNSFIISGLLLGGLILTVPTFTFLLPILVLWFLFKQEYLNMRRFLVTIIIACLVVGLWSWRNYRTVKALVPISANSGLNLLLGNSENARPNAGVNTDINKYLDEAKALSLNEVQRDQYYSAKAKAWIATHKLAAIKLYFFKILNNFNYRNDLYTKTEASFLTDLISLCTYGPLLILFLLRIILWHRWTPVTFEKLLIAIYIISGLAYAIYFPRIRFRIPFDLLMIMVAAIFLGKVFTRQNKKPKAVE